MSTSPNRSRPRRFRLLFTLTLALLLTGLIAPVALPAYQQHQVVAEIEQWGGHVELEPGGPQWLRDLLGQRLGRCLDEVRSVDLRGTPISDADLAWLARLPNLRQLSLDTTAVTDAGLARLERLRQLEVLSLAGTQVTDAGLEHLQKLPKLRQLETAGTQVSSAGLQQLQQRLEHVHGAQ